MQEKVNIIKDKFINKEQSKTIKTKQFKQLSNQSKSQTRSKLSKMERDVKFNQNS